MRTSPLPMLSALALLLGLLSLGDSPPAQAEEGEDATPPTYLAMGRATVLASPGCPAALESFLPRGKPPQPLAWPLPAQGAVLVLGLPSSDAVARQIADLFQFDVEPGSLRGGYVVHAWQDGDRNLVFVFGADAAALHAARFEFETSAPMEMLNPNMRSLDFRKPNQQAGVLVRSGTRWVRGQYQVRALALRGAMNGSALRQRSPIGRHAASRIAGAHGNQAWLDETYTRTAEGQGLVRALTARGITVVHTLRWSAEPGPAVSVATWAAAMDPERRLENVALVFETPLHIVRQMGSYYRAYEANVARKVARFLRPRLEHLYVVPRCHSDRLAKTHGEPPDLSSIPEAAIAWSGPLEHATVITRADAERRVHAAAVPVLLLDTWSAPFTHRAHRPTLPSQRAADLGQVLAGVVVVESPTFDALLASAWSPRTGPPPDAGPLEEMAFAEDLDGQALLAEALSRLERAQEETQGWYRWLGPLAAELKAVRAPVARIPLIAADIVADGRLDEAAWKHARVLTSTPQGLELRVFSDGSALHVGLRVSAALTDKGPYLIRLHLRAPQRAAPWLVEFSPKEDILERLAGDKPGAGRVGTVRLTNRAAGAGREIEVSFDRFALGGDAHALRSFRFDVSVGREVAWPPAAEKGASGTLLVVR